MTKKLLLSFLSLSLILPSLFSPTSAALAYNPSSAQTYLLAHSGNPWSTMALSVLGASGYSTDYLKNISGSAATDYEAPILAITALGQDPRTWPTTDYVAKLESFHTSSQLGDSSLLNDDIFGMLALKSAGVPVSDVNISDSKTFVLAHQNTDGGWGFSTSAGSDSNTTAAAVTALTAVGVSSSDSHITAALNYLKTAQNSDGGFTYDPTSTFGTDSDTSSTSWVVWALDSLGADLSSWSKGGHSPLDYISSNQNNSGFFSYQSGTAEDSFSPVTTAYAVIALAGKTLPTKTITASSAIFVPFRIEGSTSTVCAGTVAAVTALDVVKNASAQCSFTYHIKDTSFGPYLDQIGTDTASGSVGWEYAVNYVLPDVGSADYQLKSGDSVLWFYADFNDKLTRLSINSTQISTGLASAQVETGQAATVKVEYLNNGSWSPLSGATVYFGTNTATTAADGTISISPANGYYQVYAQGSGYVRSNAVLLQVGQPTGANVSMTVNIPEGQVNGTSTGQSSISFTVDPSSIDFGTLTAGQTSAVKNLKLTNTGTVAINIQSIVSGADVFKNGLTLNQTSWNSFKLPIAVGQNQTAGARLTVPLVTPGSSSTQNGQIVFWATAQ